MTIALDWLAAPLTIITASALSELGACQCRQQVGLLADVRGGRVGDGARELELRRVLTSRARPRTARRGRPASGRRAGSACRCRVELARRRDDVDDAAALGRADQVGMRAGRAEALEVAAHDRVAGVDPGLELGVDVGDVGGLRAVGGGAGRARRRRRCRWCRARRRSPASRASAALPLGTLTIPETAAVLPCGVFDV